MSFFVMAEQRRYRIRYRGREEFFFAFAKRPARRVFKEQFATRGGGGRLSRPGRTGAGFQESPRNSGLDAVCRRLGH